MKTFEDYQKAGNEVIKSGNKKEIELFSKAKKTLIVRAEYNGEVYETEADGTRGVVSLALGNKDVVVGTQCGETKAIMNMMVRLMMGLPEEIRYRIMLKVATGDMLKMDMKQDE